MTQTNADKLKKIIENEGNTIVIDRREDKEIIKEFEERYKDKIIDELNKLFPKHKCKERRQALVFNALFYQFSQSFLKDALDKVAKTTKVNLPGIGLTTIGEGTVPVTNKKSLTNEEMIDSLQNASNKDYYDDTDYYKQS